MVQAIELRIVSPVFEGSYLGTLEVTQDLTRLRQLQGERRLLEFEAEA